MSNTPKTYVWIDRFDHSRAHIGHTFTNRCAPPEENSMILVSTVDCDDLVSAFNMEPDDAWDLDTTPRKVMVSMSLVKEE